MTRVLPNVFVLLATVSLGLPSSTLTDAAEQISKPSIRRERSVGDLRSVRIDGQTKEKYRVGVCSTAGDDVVMYNMTYDECIIECRSRPLCTAINLYTKVGVCRLNFQNNLPEESCPKYIFSEKKTWIKKMEAGCETIVCPINHKCMNVDGHHSCRPSECQNIASIQNGVVFGNSLRFGKSRGFKCDEGFTLIGSSKITCQSNGEWSNGIPICAASSMKTTIDPAPNNDGEFSGPDTSSTNGPQRTTTTSELTYLDIPKYSTDTNTGLSGTTKVYDYYSNSSHIQYPTGYSVTYPITNYSMSCDATRSCVEENLECRYGRCLCVFGSVYDPKLGICVTYCDKRGVTFQIYENVTVSGYTRYVEHVVVGLYSCEQKCYELDCYFMIANSSLGTRTECTFYSYYLPAANEKQNSTDFVTYVRDCSGEDANNTIGICVDGWTIGFSHCYKYVQIGLTFEDAKNHCERLGGKLAEPTNGDDNEFLKHELHYIYASYHAWWIGIKGNGHFWVWSSTYIPINYLYWAPGHPNMYMNETTGTNNTDGIDDVFTDGYYYHCAAFDPTYSAWISAHCTRVFYSICEMDFEQLA